MTIQVEISAETESRLTAQAAARRMDVPAYASTLLEVASQPAAHKLQDVVVPLLHPRAPGRKSLAQLFADSPFKGLDVDFERDPDVGRQISL